LLTTPEVITQVLMAGPLYMLYEITVWIAWYWDQADRARARRRLLLGLFILFLAAVLLWAGYKYVLPWVRPHFYFGG